jgi:uncharacterized protein GlcG (DUF336 family)
MRTFRPSLALAAGVALLLAAPLPARAQKKQCPVSHDQLVQVLRQNVKASGGPDNGGLPVNEWAAVVNRDGVVCAVAFSGTAPTDQWLGSRAIAVEKANTVNAFGLDKYAISTANLWAQAQPGGYLYGGAASNPPVAQEIYRGDPSKFGTGADPLVGKVLGGVIVFGGGLALYHDGKLVGGLGASGNTSCADHNIAWRIRQKLGMDQVPNGPSPQHNDAIIYDVGPDGKSESGWGHPECGHNAPQIAKQIGSGIVSVAQSGKPPEQPATQGAASRQQPAAGTAPDQHPASPPPPKVKP